MQNDVTNAISTFEDRQKTEARARDEALSTEMGNSLAELIGIDRKTARVPAVAKYRYPESPAIT